ncbi:FixJ family two-component response regulator [Sphingomonas trueperi]|uniref:response regulator transcription factor n=1 Tax=Sphingomonas trueperi TaxID=53317 RepID=UPI0033988FA9
MHVIDRTGLEMQSPFWPKVGKSDKGPHGPFGGAQVPLDSSDDLDDRSTAPFVVVVDDDPMVREVILSLLETVDIEVLAFGSGREMLQADLPDRPGCFVLDVRMPGLSGLDVQQILLSQGSRRPIVFLTGHGDIAMSVQAMKLGAVDFLTKPFRHQALLDAIARATEQDRNRRAADEIVNRRAAMLATLTPRERQVLRAVVTGRINKQIAYELGISEITVKLHRGSMMRKLRASSVGDLVRLWEWLPPPVRDHQLAGS